MRKLIKKKHLYIIITPTLLDTLTFLINSVLISFSSQKPRINRKSYNTTVIFGKINIVPLLMLVLYHQGNFAVN